MEKFCAIFCCRIVKQSERDGEKDGEKQGQREARTEGTHGHQQSNTTMSFNYDPRNPRGGQTRSTSQDNSGMHNKKSDYTAKQQEEFRAQLEKLLSMPGNNDCADCGARGTSRTSSLPLSHRDDERQTRRMIN